jgi:GT2 family glycosyltransferase
MQPDSLISIVVPAYNEADDIRRTLEALVAQTYPRREILVVDDCSTDETASIAREYSAQGVRVLQTPRRSERCAARNLGIRAARGDVVAILNADVFPASDYLCRIAAHYRRGADYVLVESHIANTEALFPRYLEALHRAAYDGQDWVEWTEGFSCRRDAALDVGLFPETPIPLSAGEDGYFGSRLAARGYRKVIDRSIVVPHVMPAALGPFWKQQVSRGRATPVYFFFIERRPLALIVARAAVKSVRFLLATALVVPVVVSCAGLCRRSPRGLRDLAGFCVARVTSLLGHVYGEWRGIAEIVRYLRARRSPAPAGGSGCTHQTTPPVEAGRVSRMSCTAVPTAPARLGRPNTPSTTTSTTETASPNSPG